MAELGERMGTHWGTRYAIWGIMLFRCRYYINSEENVRPYPLITRYPRSTIYPLITLYPLSTSSPEVSYPVVPIHPFPLSTLDP
jgi:hypothetical protein